MENNKKNDSVLKGGEFLIKESSFESLLIPEAFDEEQKMIAGMCAEFLEAEVRPHLDRLDKHEEGLLVSMLNKAGDLGLLGSSLPEEYGGFGKDFVTSTIISEVIGGGHSFSVAILVHNGIGMLPILYFGNEEQKKKYLPKLATGELKGCYALTEPDSGSDALAAKSKAVFSDDGKHLILNGVKMWITNAGFADLFIVFAQVDGKNLTDDQKGFTGLIVDRDTQGLTLGEEENKLGIKGSSTRQVFFEDCKIPVENVLGDLGKGHLIAFNILNIGRFKLCAAALGGAKIASSQSVAYANERFQFKQPISSFGAMKHKLAEQAIRIFACESALYRTSQLINTTGKQLAASGTSYGASLLGAAKEYAIECAMLKVYGSEMLDFVVDEGLQIYGGAGFSEDYPMARAYRDSRINRIFEGTNEINRLLTVDMLLKKAMKGEIDLMGPAKALQKELMGIPVKGTGDEGIFANEDEAIKNMKKAILLVSGSAVQKYMEKLGTEQEIIMDIADMVIETYVSESMLLRAKKYIEMKGEQKSKYIIEMTRVYFREAMDKISVSGKNAISSFAAGDELRMLQMGLKRFTKIDPVNTKELRRSIAGKLIDENKYCF